MSSQIDPRLYASQPPPPTATPHQQPSQSPHHAPSTSRTSDPIRLPRIYSAADSPAQPNPNQFQALHQHPQPYYYTPPSRNPPLQPATPLDYRSSYSHHSHYERSGGDADEDRQSSASPADDRPGNEANDTKRARACESCRGLKVRCDQEDPSKPCRRCAKAKRECIITQPSRKRQKKADNRVAELEKKIDALTASLQAHRDYTPSAQNDDQRIEGHSHQPVNGYSNTSPEYAGPSHPADSHPSSSKRRLSTQDAGTPRKRSKLAGSSPHKAIPAGQQGSSSNAAFVQDPMDTGLTQSTAAYVGDRIADVISDDEASQFFYHYVADMATHMPAVLFPSDMKAEDVRNTRPVTFLSILVAGSVGLISVEKQDRLAALLLGIFADSIVRNGEKSLDLVQALLVATIWYRPPKKYEQMNFYQLGHMAAVMAIEMGMGKRSYASKASRVQPGIDQMRMPRFLFNSESLEARRTWLGCYFNCTHTSMSLRRPALIRWNTYMSECVSVLESSEEHLESDLVLCELVKMQRLNEDIGARFSMDDPSAAIAISDKPVQLALRKFETQLDDMVRDLRNALGEPKSHSRPSMSRDAAAALAFSQEVTKLYMHEIALHINHNVDDFRAPFTEESLRASSGQSVVASPAHTKAIAQCLSATHAIFDAFFAFDPAMIRALPIFYFVRVAYAVVVLIKLHFAITAPGSEVSKIITKEQLQVEKYLDTLLRLFQALDNDDAFRPANKFLFILGKMHAWFQKNKECKDLPRDRSRFDPYAARIAAEGAMQPQKRQGSRKSSAKQQEPIKTTRQEPEPIGRHMKYDNSTALHFLSDVAANASTATPQVIPPVSGDSRPPEGQSYIQTQQQQQPPAHAGQQWYGGWGQPQGAAGVVNGTGAEVANFGMPFEQAMDMTLGGAGNSELSSIFMGDSTLDFSGAFDEAGNMVYYQRTM